MKNNLAIRVTIALVAALSFATAIAFAEQGGEHNNTGCNGVGNANSPCSGTNNNDHGDKGNNGHGGSSLLGSVTNVHATNTNHNTNMLTGTVTGVNVNKNSNANTNTNANTLTGTNMNSNTVHASGGNVQGSGNSTATGGSVIESGNSRQDQNQSQNQQINDSGNSSVSGSGNSTISNEVRNVGNPNITIEAAKPALPAPMIPQVSTAAPVLFYQNGMPANAAGTRLALAYLSECTPTFSEVSVREIREWGSSGKTRAIFSPHSNYRQFTQGETVMPRASVVLTPEKLPASVAKCTCLGLLQVEAVAKEASDVPLATIVQDAGLFARHELRGFTDIKLILIPSHSVSVNIGTDASGNGLGAAPGLSGLIGNVLGVLGVNAAMSNGRTFPAAQVGATFALVAGGDIPEGAITVDIGAFMESLRQQTKK